MSSTQIFFLLRIPPCQDLHLGSQCRFFFPCLFSRWSRHSCSQNTRAVGIYIVVRGAQVPLNINRRLWASHFGENGLVSNLINATKREKKMHAVPSPKHFIRSKTASNPLGVRPHRNDYIAHRDVQFTASFSKMKVKTRTFMQSATRLNML